jgi:hypothetical protein
MKMYKAESKDTFPVSFQAAQALEANVTSGLPPQKLAGNLAEIKLLSKAVVARCSGCFSTLRLHYR